jgi:hypothetical protein
MLVINTVVLLSVDSFRNHSLANARFANDQNIVSSMSNLSDLLPQLLYRFASSDDCCFHCSEPVF